MTDRAAVEMAITRVHREEWARVVASLTRRFGDLDLAEEMSAATDDSGAEFIEALDQLFAAGGDFLA